MAITILEVATDVKSINHSVVQLDMDGNVLMSNDSAIFANSKDNAKNFLGSVEKISDREFLIGDSINKRAIIVELDLSSLTSKIVWEYKSDKYIVDCHIVQKETDIVVNDSNISPSTVTISKNRTVTWENNTSHPITILSGTTTFDDFQTNPDLDVYGDIFRSSVLQPGERFAYKFVSIGEIDWFTYPDILTGTITVTRDRIFNDDEIVILESDNLSSPFTSRVIKVDMWGNVLWSFGEGYLVKPRDARPLLDGGVLIST